MDEIQFNGVGVTLYNKTVILLRCAHSFATVHQGQGACGYF